jgi:pimeloyl-ACP methyl ester carboxylesterase
MNRSKLNEFKSGRSFLSAIAIAIAAMFVVNGPMVAQGKTQMTSETNPTIVLVHGAFADSSSWEGVIPILLAQGYPVVAAANPLRGVKSDADYVSTVLNSIKGPIVLVAHSYGGMVTTNAVKGNSNVQALVYVDAFAPDAGESANALVVRYPGSELGTAIFPVPLPGGRVDIYIQQDKVPTVFAGDFPKASAGDETSGEPAWKGIPSWFIYGDKDLVIPPALLGFMAERAHSRGTVVVKGASHVSMISHPEEVAKLIVTAATERTATAKTAR